MRRSVIVLLYILYGIGLSSGQEVSQKVKAILFHGIVMDSETKIPLAGSQIIINRAFSSVSDNEGKFAFYVNRFDTVKFSMLGYKSTILYISDTLRGSEFIAGIYMHTDTLSIEEIVIVPRLRSIKSNLFNPGHESNFQIENAKYNLEVSAYQGKITWNKMGDPATNYEFLKQKQFAEAYTKGQIPSDRIVGINPLLILPAAYLLMNGFPQKSPPLNPSLTDYELNMIYKKYLETYGKE